MINLHPSVSALRSILLQVEHLGGLNNNPNFDNLNDRPALRNKYTRMLYGVRNHVHANMAENASLRGTTIREESGLHRRSGGRSFLLL